MSSQAATTSGPVWLTCICIQPWNAKAYSDAVFQGFVRIYQGDIGCCHYEAVPNVEFGWRNVILLPIRNIPRREGRVPASSIQCTFTPMQLWNLSHDRPKDLSDNVIYIILYRSGLFWAWYDGKTIRFFNSADKAQDRD
jgi:hypothetical protein